MDDLDHLDAEELPPTLALVTMLSKNVHRAAADRDGNSGSLKQVIALSYLRELGTVGQRYFGPVLCLDANNTVLLLNELEADGLVVRKRDPEDRRRHVVELTETGHEVLRKTEGAMGDIEDDLLAALSPEQRATFRGLLHQVMYGENGVLRRANAAVASA